MGGDLTGSCYDNWALEKHICRRLPQGVEDHIKSASGLFALRHLHQPVSLPFDSCTDTCHPSFLSPRLPSKTVLRVPIRKRTTPGAARRKGKRMTKRKSPTGHQCGTGDGTGVLRWNLAYTNRPYWQRRNQRSVGDGASPVPLAASAYPSEGRRTLVSRLMARGGTHPRAANLCLLPPLFPSLRHWFSCWNLSLFRRC
jgi:hypothetical protein